MSREYEVHIGKGYVPVTESSLSEPAPTHQPGDVAIATVRGPLVIEGVLVVLDQYGEWHAPVEGMSFRRDQVTVTSRAVVATEEDEKTLLQSIYNAMSEPNVNGWYGAKKGVRTWFAAKLGGGR